MISLCKSLFKTTLIGTAVIGTLAGGALLVAGPARTKAVLHDVRTKISHAIDQSLDDPIALRDQLRELEREYPKRIAKVRGDLVGLKRDMRQLERERAISLRVVELAEEDLKLLRPALEKTSSANGHNARLAAVAFDDRIYTLRRATEKVRSAEQTIQAHAARAEDAKHQYAFLAQQAGQFEEVLAQLESERAQFQIQLQQLERQVDSIQRNQRLIKLLEKRKRTLEECTTYDVVSLDQLTGKLEEILNRQAATLDVLTCAEEAAGYEELAREELRRVENVRQVVEMLDCGVHQEGESR